MGMYVCMYTMHDKTEFDFTEGYVQSLSFHYRQYHLKTVIKVNYFSLGYCTEIYVRTYTRGETFSHFICMQILSFDTCVHTYIHTYSTYTIKLIHKSTDTQCVTLRDKGALEILRIVISFNELLLVIFFIIFSVRAKTKSLKLFVNCIHAYICMYVCMYVRRSTCKRCRKYIQNHS